MNTEKEIVEFYKKKIEEVKCPKKAITKTMEAFSSINWIEVINPILAYNFNLKKV